MPQFLSATTTTTSQSSNVTTAAENTGPTINVNAKSDPEEGVVEDEGEGKNRSYHLRSKSIHQHNHHQVLDEESSDGGVHAEYSDDEGLHRDNGHKNGYHLKISSLETVPRTPKEHFSDQVGFKGMN